MAFIAREINVSTNEIVEREFTKAELAAVETENEKIQARLQQEEAREKARQSAIEKLAAIGLTEAEIQALAG